MADDYPAKELEPREPSVEDLRDLCRELNQRGAKYIVIGGFAMRALNYVRSTMDIDLLVAGDAENEQKVLAALATLPDKAAREIQPGELQRYSVIRVCDEIVVDLTCTAGGVGYTEAAKDIYVREVDGVPIPFASARLLWRTKARSRREKDAADMLFLRQWFAERNETPPE